jgi:AcrR family transcriptional regulator
MSAETTRDKILEAALKLFSQKGFLGATTRDIAKAARVAEVTLFRHFPSKEKLFEEVIRRYSFLPALKGILPGLEQASYEEALLEIARRFLATLDERRDLVRIMLAQRHLYPAQVKKIFRGFLGEMIRMLADYFYQLQGKGILRPFDPESGAKAFLGAFFAYVNFLGFFLEPSGKSHAEKFAGDYVRIFIKGTLADHPSKGNRWKETAGEARKRRAG